MKGTRGFTLVELMAAAMLAGAVLLTQDKRMSK